MDFEYQASAPYKGREKNSFEFISCQGSSPVDRLIERGVEVDFSNQEVDCLWEVLGELKGKRSHFWHDPKQVSSLFFL